MSELPTFDDQATSVLPSGDSEGGGTPGTGLLSPFRLLGAGRYVSIGELGRGGMGLVLRAYDPTLQREVALKLLQTKAIEENARDRLVREARAMAQLSHPHVVAVYDVVDEDDLVLVMEYVPGESLDRWLRSAPRSQSEILDAFVQAGRGLAAAHDQGLLHRDFKPANVLVGSDGRVRVTDFGLARLEDVDPSGVRDAEAIVADGSLGTLTMEGQIMGTPRYMAPEQHAGEQLTTAADQYAWCVSLWEALVGRPPFEGRALELIAARKRAGPPAWPDEVAAPSRVVEALRRGLAVDPLERFPSMSALLEAVVEPVQVRRGWPGLLVLLGATLCLGAAWLLVEGRGPSRCSGAREAIADAWSDARRGEAEAAVLGTELVFAEDTWTRVGPGLDAYAGAWVQQHTDACEATERGEQSAAALDLRMGCLRQARSQLRAAVDLLLRADLDIVERATTLVDELPPLERCEAPLALETDALPPGEEIVAAVEAVREVLVEAQALDQGNKLDDALAVVQEQRAKVDAIDYAPLRTELEHAAGRVALHAGRDDEAQESLDRALGLALASGQWSLAGRVASELAHLHGERRKQTDVGLAYASMATGLFERKPDRLETLSLRGTIGSILRHAGELERAEAEHRAVLASCLELGPGSACEGRARNNLANTLSAAGRYDEAEVEHRLALAWRREHLGPKHPFIAQSLNNLATSMSRQGKHAEATALLRETVELRTEVLGPDHPGTAAARMNLGIALARQARFEDAERQLRAALASRERAYGPNDVRVGDALFNLGNVLSDRNPPEAAEAVYRRALTIFEAAPSPDEGRIARVHINLGQLLNDQGKSVEAEAYQRRALELYPEQLGPTHPSVGLMQANYSDTLRALGRLEEAESSARQAIAILEGRLPAGHTHRVFAHLELAQALVAQGRAEEGLEVLQSDRAKLDDDDPRFDLMGTRAMVMAEATWALGDGNASRAHAREALAIFEREPLLEEAAAEARTWLDEHRG